MDNEEIQWNFKEEMKRAFNEGIMIMLHYVGNDKSFSLINAAQGVQSRLSSVLVLQNFWKVSSILNHCGKGYCLY